MPFEFVLHWKSIYLPTSVLAKKLDWRRTFFCLRAIFSLRPSCFWSIFCPPRAKWDTQKCHQNHGKKCSAILVKTSKTLPLPKRHFLAPVLAKACLMSSLRLTLTCLENGKKCHMSWVNFDVGLRNEKIWKWKLRNVICWPDFPCMKLQWKHFALTFNHVTKPLLTLLILIYPPTP